MRAEDYARIRRLVYDRSAIVLGENKRYLLAGGALRQVLRHRGEFHWGEDRQEKQRFLSLSRRVSPVLTSNQRSSSITTYPPAVIVAE